MDFVHLEEFIVWILLILILFVLKRIDLVDFLLEFFYEYMSANNFLFTNFYLQISNKSVLNESKMQNLRGFVPNLEWGGGGLQRPQTPSLTHHEHATRAAQTFCAPAILKS